MGLDTVELVMEVEDAFDITIDDRDAETITTIGALYQYVLARLGPSPELARPIPCLSAATFYRVRRAIIAATGLDRRVLRPGLAMTEILARCRRRATWDRISLDLDLRLPPLERPRWVRHGLMGLVLRMTVSAFAGMVILLGADSPAVASALMLTLLVVLPGLAILAALLSTPLATRFPSGCGTLGEATGLILRMNPGAIQRATGVGLGDEEVWSALLHVVATQAGVPAERLTADTSFVRDLGMG